MTSLKLIERNVPKDKIAMLSIPMIPVKIIITIWEASGSIWRHLGE